MPPPIGRRGAIISAPSATARRAGTLTGSPTPSGGRANAINVHDAPALDLGARVVLPFTNNTGAAVTGGQVVQIDNTTAAAVASFSSTLIYAIALRNIAAGAIGPFVVLGDTYVACSGTVLLGEYVTVNYLSGLLESMHIKSGSILAPPARAAGLCTEASGNGFCRIYFFGRLAERDTYDPNIAFELSSDFIGGTGGANTAGVVANETWDGLSFRRLSAAVATATPPGTSGGVIGLDTDSTAAGPLLQVGGAALTFPLFIPLGVGGIVVPYFTMEMRFGQRGAGVGTRRIGLLGAAPAIAAASPANGIYVRYTAGGNFIAVCRVGGVETSLDLGLAAADGALKTVRAVYDLYGGPAVHWWISLAYVGSIATNVPNVPLGWGCEASVTTASYYVDMVRIYCPRGDGAG